MQIGVAAKKAQYRSTDTFLNSLTSILPNFRYLNVHIILPTFQVLSTFFAFYNELSIAIFHLEYSSLQETSENCQADLVFKAEKYIDMHLLDFFFTKLIFQSVKLSRTSDSEKWNYLQHTSITFLKFTDLKFLTID